jgi:glycosyltransferase involved in cell wall biosynthesis
MPNRLISVIVPSARYVSTSIYEEFNYSLLEALSRGRVVVVSNISAHKDHVINNQTGFLSDPYHDISFSIALRKLVYDVDLYNQLRRASVSHILEKFD